MIDYFCRCISNFFITNKPTYEFIIWTSLCKRNFRDRNCILEFCIFNSSKLFFPYNDTTFRGFKINCIILNLITSKNWIKSHIFLDDERLSWIVINILTICFSRPANEIRCRIITFISNKVSSIA